MKEKLKRAINTLLDVALPASQQERIGAYIYHRVRGENNDAPEVNGEYNLASRIAEKSNGNGVLFDIGANCGDWSLAVARKVSDVYAFEPSLETFEILQNRIEIAGAGMIVHPVRVALSDTDGTGSFYVSGHAAGSNSLHTRLGCDVQAAQVKEVALIRGDTFCARENISHIHLLKIDTEGHELKVINGFERMLALGSIDCVQFEYGGTWIDSRCYLREAFTLFESHGYRLGKLMPDKVMFTESYSQKFENFVYANWIAVRKGALTAFNLDRLI